MMHMRSNRDWIFGALLLAVTLVVYWPAVKGTPLWDDEANITSPELRSGEGLLRIWTHLGATQQYYPLVHTVNWIEYRLWGDRTSSRHLLNILLHVLSALLLFRILRKLKVPGARLAAAFFALHPVMVESVAWVTELKNTLSGVFFFGASLAFLSFSEGSKRKYYFIALGLFILGLMSKTSIVPFPLVMLAMVWWKRGKLFWKHDIVPMVPFFLAGLLFGLITSYVERTFIGATGRDFSFSVIERCLIAGRAVWFYLSKIFWPADLVFIYPRWSVSQGVWWQYLFPAAALLTAGTLGVLRRRWRAPLAAFLFFSAMLLPVLGFFNVFAFRFSFVADHWQYLAAVGPITLAAAGINRTFALVNTYRRFLKPVVYGVLLSTIGLLSWKQSSLYVNAETLYRDIVSRNPSCWMAHNNLGILLAQTGRNEEAIAHYRKAVQENPDYAPARYNLGNLLRKTGQADEAVVHLKKALEIHPDNARTHFNLGNALMKTGRSGEGIARYRMALEISPGFIDAYFNLACALTLEGKTDEAVAEFRRALEISPGNIRILNGLRMTLLNAGRRDEAISAVRMALEAAKSSGQESLARMIEEDLKKLTTAVDSIRK
jgi:tetratricopeptide (TPR) repeat protein